MSEDIIRKYKVKAKKKLWQNFLINDEIISSIAWVIDISGKNIIEIWPGYWALSEKLLLHKPKSLTLVEIDLDMISILEDRVYIRDLDISWVDFSINKIDVLEYDPQFSSYDVIANIPYYITSPILRHFLYDLRNKPDNMVILMQKDVWDKILWFPKNKSSVLSLIVEKKANVSEKIFVAKENFIPSPKVESSVLLFKSHNIYDDISDEKFLKIIKIWFSSVRKKLINNLEKWWYDSKTIIKILSSMWYDSNIRWEDLNIENWCELVRNI